MRAHKQKKLDLWLNMLWQLRYRSKVTAHIPPGDCQAMLDYLTERECGTTLRHDSASLVLQEYTAEELFSMLPTRAHTTRQPGSEEGHPIFIKRDTMIYLDGRRRINKWNLENPKQKHKVWVIHEI